MTTSTVVVASTKPASLPFLGVGHITRGDVNPFVDKGFRLCTPPTHERGHVQVELWAIPEIKGCKGRVFLRRFGSPRCRRYLRDPFLFKFLVHCQEDAHFLLRFFRYVSMHGCSLRILHTETAAGDVSKLLLVQLS